MPTWGFRGGRVLSFDRHQGYLWEALTLGADCDSSCLAFCLSRNCDCKQSVLEFGIYTFRIDVVRQCEAS